MLRRCIALLICVCSCMTLLARDYTGYRYFDDADIGLPSGSEVGIGVVIALIAIPIGYMILNMSNSNKREGNTFVGCLGAIFIIGGVIGLIPLFAWVCSIGSVLYMIGIALFLIIALIAFVFSKKK